MTHNGIDYVCICPNCHNNFFRLSKTAVEVKACLGDINDEWLYCSQSCMDERLSCVNKQLETGNMVLISKEKVSDNPTQWVFNFEALEVEREIS